MDNILKKAVVGDYVLFVGKIERHYRKRVILDIVTEVDDEGYSNKVYSEKDGILSLEGKEKVWYKEDYDNDWNIRILKGKEKQKWMDKVLIADI